MYFYVLKSFISNNINKEFTIQELVNEIKSCKHGKREILADMHLSSVYRILYFMQKIGFLKMEITRKRHPKRSPVILFTKTNQKK